MKIEWKQEYSVGINEIDDQHKRFFVIIEKLDDIVQSGGTREDTVRTLTDLASYANYHFSVEEKYFEQYEYEETEAHTAMHNAYEKKLEDFIERLKGDDPALAPDLATFSKEWLISHILKEDKKYSETFIENGFSDEDIPGI